MYFLGDCAKLNLKNWAIWQICWDAETLIKALLIDVTTLES